MDPSPRARFTSVKSCTDMLVKVRTRSSRVEKVVLKSFLDPGVELEWRRRWLGMAWRGAQGLRWNWPGIVIPNNSAGVELQFQGNSEGLDF